MPFYALVDARTGDIIDVVTYLDGPSPPGVMVVELPARWEDVEAYLRARRRDRGGGGGGEVLLERDEQSHSKGEQRREMTDAEEFYARLEAQLGRSETERRTFSVLLFDLAPADRGDGHAFVLETLASHGQELLPCDVLARLREHLVAVLMPDIDARDQRITVHRGDILALVYPHDADAIRSLARRRHPWLKPRALRTDARSA